MIGTLKTSRGFDTAERFWQKVDIREPNECWLWLGAISGAGYPQFWYNGRLGYAHVYACEIAFGWLKRGQQVDHKCKNRRCVNSWHLEAVSKWENIKRAYAA